MTDLIINFATRSRPQQFLKSIQNITDTISTNNYRILISADLDDTEMNCDAMREKISAYPNTEIYYNEHSSKVGAINATIPHFGEFYWLVNHSDDIWYKESGWDVKMLDQIKSVWGDSTDFFAHFPDNYVNEKLPTLNVCGYDYYMRDGYIYFHGYGGFSCDAENMFVAMMRGRYKYFPQVYFHHVHPSNCRFEPDLVYKLNDKHGLPDTALYFERMERLFDVKDPVMIPEQLRRELKERGVIV